ncbi:MAG: threonine--tRNA ligase [Actinobacteria bacterium]|nr:threonine--tRNA ligase [Actinomycetota bacterium]
MADQISVTLPDGSSKGLPAGATTADLAASIGRSLAKAAVAGVVNGHEVDLTAPLPDGAEVSVITDTSEEGRAVLRHSTSHVMAQAVLQLWPGAKFAIGPPVKDGFYYDFELPDGQHFTDEDLERIEARMREIVAEDQPFVREEHSVDEGLELFADQPFKVEIIHGVREADTADTGDMAATEGAEAGVVSAYRNTDRFVDLCRGPHVPSTKRLGHFKLLNLAAAYWRGDEKRPQLQRVYGTAWESKAQLDEHLWRLEEAKKRDHRKLGEELDLFAFDPDVGRGLPLWLPKGTVIRDELEAWARETERRWGYQRVVTPHIARGALFRTSGHLPYYQEDLYAPIDIDGDDYYLKPMNCPHHHMVFKARAHSYRELPLRYAEYGNVYRYEKSGALFGLMRARGFTQNDAHIYCSKADAKEEFLAVMRLHAYYYEALGIDDFHMVLALKDPKNTEKYHGDDDMWEEAERLTRDAMEESGIPYVEELGGAAHYGPKVDFIIRSAIGREFAASTNQLDLYMPERFDLRFTNAHGVQEHPAVIHRAPLGSHERFVGFLLEHYAGNFPTWLAPVQVQVLPVAADHREYARGVVDRLFDDGYRVELVEADEPLGARIRHGKLQKVPYILVVGGQDIEGGTVGVNHRGDERPDRDVPIDEFIERLRAEVATKARW